MFVYLFKDFCVCVCWNDVYARLCCMMVCEFRCIFPFLPFRSIPLLSLCLYFIPFHPFLFIFFHYHTFPSLTDVFWQIAILMGCAVLPHLRQMVEIVEHGLVDEQQKVNFVVVFCDAGVVFLPCYRYCFLGAASNIAINSVKLAYVM